VRRVQNLNGSRMILNFTGAWLSPRSTIFETTWRFRRPSVSFVRLKSPAATILELSGGTFPSVRRGEQFKDAGFGCKVPSH
jgi:hypothetical protein